MKRLLFFLCAVMLCSAQIWGQTWDLTETMTATLDGNGVLTIFTTKSGGEEMPESYILPWWYGYGNLSDNINSLVIKDGVTAIKMKAFYHCVNLSSATIPNSVTSIGESAFASCTNLISVTIPNSLKMISRSTFEDCTGLTSVSIPNSVTMIDDFAFDYCSSLTSIKIPKSVETIGGQCFGYCESLKDVTVEWATPLLLNASHFFQTNISAATLHVPAGTRTLYRAADIWKNFGTIDDGTVEAIYNPGDIAVINAMIDNNGLKWTKAPADGSSVPADWAIILDGMDIKSGVAWLDDAINKRIIGLSVPNQSLTGDLDVSSLTYLQYLYCYQNQLTSLDVSGLTGLIGLDCHSNNLISLDVHGFTNLQILQCNNNNLISLNVSGLINLYRLVCAFNSLTSLDVSSLTNLTYLDCGYNNSLTSLNVTGLTKLEWFDCESSSLTSFDASRFTNLQYLGFQGSKLASLNVKGLTKLYALDCGYNNLTSLDISGLTNLNRLVCAGNSLTSLNLSGLTNLTYIYCPANKLTSLDVSGLPNLDFLECSINYITSLNVKGLTNLSQLGCGNNKLTSLDVSGLIKLQLLDCNNNNLTTLDLTGLNSLSNSLYSGSGQTRAFDFTGTSGNYTANIAFGAGATFENTALSYSNGILTSTSNIALNSGFTSPTGKAGFELTGTLTMTYPDSPSVIAGEEEPAGTDGKGSVSLSLAVPTDAALSGSFDIQFPAGMTLDQDLTALSAELSGNSTLSITPKDNNTWQIQIGNEGLRSATAIEYRKIIDIAYQVDKTVANGKYEALITNLDFTLSDDTKIQEASLPVTITVDNTITGILELQSETLAYLNNGTLHIQSPIAETVQVYSTSGVLLYNFQKPTGKANFPLNELKGSVLIVKGSSGWVKKIVKK